MILFEASCAKYDSAKKVLCKRLLYASVEPHDH